MSYVSIVNTSLLLIFILFFGITFYKEHKDPASPLRWIDMLLDNRTNRLSLSKLGQFWGIAFSSWIVLYFAQRIPEEKIVEVFVLVFGSWLAFLVGSYTLTSVLKHKDSSVEFQKEKEK